MTALEGVRRLVDDARIELVEATCVTDRNADYESACAKGVAHLRRKGARLDTVIDVCASRHIVQPI
jgi:hypothetical protein